MKPTLVTVAIALYNNEAYVERCVMSVIGQTYPHLEVIIVDDGSTDSSLRICEKYNTDDRIELLKKENGGLSSARQWALDKAKGDFICFIDADDYLDKCYVEQMLNKIESDSADICVCSTKFENETGDYLVTQSKFYHCTEAEKPYRININYLEKENFPLNISITDSWNKMYRVTFLRQCKACFSMPKGLNGSDTVFNMKLALNEPVYTTCSEELYNHVIYKSSAAHRKKKDLYQSFCFLVEQLYAEGKRLRRVEQISIYISKVYCSCFRHASQDVSDEYVQNQERNEALKDLLNKHKRFMADNPYIVIDWKSQNTFSTKLFVLILQVYPGLLPCYLTMRKRLMNVIS